MQTGDAQPKVANLDVTPERPQVRLTALAGVLAAGSLVLSSGVESEAVRLRILSGFLLVLAAAEGFFGLAALFPASSRARLPASIFGSIWVSTTCSPCCSTSSRHSIPWQTAP